MKIENIHLQVLLPVFSLLKIQSCEISTNCFGQHVLMCSGFKLGKICIDDFGNIKGNIENIHFFTRTNSFGEIDIFVDNKRIYYQEDCFGACVLSFNNNHIFFKKTSFGNYTGYLNRTKFSTKKDLIGRESIEFYESYSS